MMEARRKADPGGSSTRSYGLFIDGEFTEAGDGKTFETYNPSDGSVVATVARAGREDVGRAIGAARRAADDEPWPRMSAAERVRTLLDMVQIMKRNQSELSGLETQDAGHTVRMSTLFTVPLAIYQWQYTAELAGRMDYTEAVPRLDFPAPAWSFVEREPYGVVGAITAWNFPFLVTAWKAASALATGNTVVLKPSPFAPVTSLELGAIAKEAGLPAGVLNVVPGTGPIAGEALVEDHRVDAVSFTGSTAVGRRVMELGARTVKKVALELGGKGPTILLDDADLDVAVRGALWGVYLHGGQACESGSRCFIPSHLYDEVTARMVELAEGMKVGSAMEYESDIGPLIGDRQLDVTKAYVKVGQEEGAKLLTGGAEPEGVPSGGSYFQPTLFGEVHNEMRIAQEEIFGPVLSLIRYDSVEDAITMANDTIYGLSGSVWSSDIPRALAVARRLKLGTVWINDHHLFSPAAPHGGYKQSGVGRELGSWGLDEFLQVKHVYVDQTPSRAQKFWLQILGL